MTRIEKLTQELRDDPLGRDYSRMADAQVEANITTKDRTRSITLDTPKLTEWALGGAMMRIKRALDAGVLGDSVLSAAWVLWRMLERENSQFDPSNPTHRGMIDTLVAGNVLLARDKADLLAKASESVSRADELGISRVRLGTIQDARRKMQ